MRRVQGTIALVAAVLATFTSARGAVGTGATPFFPGCESSSAGVSVGRVTCRQMPSRLIGGTTAFSYFVPPDCAPNLGRRCPVLYFLHGFGGDYTSEIGTGDHPSTTVAALTKGPRVDPHAVSDPWNESDPSQWVARAPIEFILVAPDGRTVPGGYGGQAGLDGFWSDWNPRYAKGGDSQRYATPAPRFESSIVDELIPYVEGHFPAGRGREWRALLGTSLGGYGSYKIGLHHPDRFSSIGSISGAHNFLLAPGPDPVEGPDLGVATPATPYLKVPGVVSDVIPLSSIPDAAKQFAVALYALGDPVGDQAYYRGNMPRDLALNGAAFAHGKPSLLIRGFSNDAIPRRSQDFTDPSSYVGAQAFEVLVRDMNIQMEQAFQDEHVPHYYDLHPGIHSGPYWDPFLREQLEAQYNTVHHWDGPGDPAPPPDVFSYRTISDAFDVWGWHFSVERAPIEFLTLTDVSCNSLTLQGTGVVTVTVPQSCRTGVKGSSRFTVDLGSPGPTDDGPDLGATPAYRRTVAVRLSSIHR